MTSGYCSQYDPANLGVVRRIRFRQPTWDPEVASLEDVLVADSGGVGEARVVGEHDFGLGMRLGSLLG